MSAAVDVTPRKQLSVLIVQLGEIEEVFRSLMAVKAVKHLYPETKIHFITRSETAAPLSRIDWIASTQVLPLAEADQASTLQSIAKWVNQLIDVRYDILCNWTFSARHLRASAILTTLIPSVVKFGNYIREDSSIAAFDAWSIYREAWLRDQSIDQDIHHTDIITTQLLTALQVHAGDPAPEAGVSVVTSKYFFSIPQGTSQYSLPKTISKWIAFHPDSLNVRYEEMIDMILRRHPDCGVVLLNDSEITLESDSLSSNARVMNLSGKLNFDSLTTVLSQSAWLISGASPMVDLANLLNVRVIYWIEAQPAITGENTYKWTETGPYGNGSVAIRFAEEFQPEVVYAAWAYAQSEWFHKGSVTWEKHFENLSLSSQLSSVEIYKSRIRNPQEGGGVSFESVKAKETDFSHWMYRLRGQIARAWFCGWLPAIDEEVEKIQLSPELIKRSRAIRESLKVIEQLSEEGKATAQSLAATARSVRNPKIMSVEDRTAIESHGKRLLELEALLSRVVNVEPELKALLSWYQHLMHNLNGETLEKMASETFQAFELVGEGVELVSLYIDKTMARAKPKAVGVSTTATESINRP